MRPVNESRRYNVTSSLIGWVHIQNDSCIFSVCIIWDKMANLDLTAWFSVHLYDNHKGQRVSVEYTLVVWIIGVFWMCLKGQGFVTYSESCSSNVYYNMTLHMLQECGKAVHRLGSELTKDILYRWLGDKLWYLQHKMCWGYHSLPLSQHYVSLSGKLRSIWYQHFGKKYKVSYQDSGLFGDDLVANNGISNTIVLEIP